MSHVNWQEPSANNHRLLLAAAFGASSMADVRRKVFDVAGQSQIGEDRLDDFVLAVNEIMANAIRHGGGGGHLRLWRNSDLVCQVRDRGSGFDAGPYLHCDRPQPSPSGGMGLWIARQTSDDLAIESGSAGTTIGIRTSLGAQAGN